MWCSHCVFCVSVLEFPPSSRDTSPTGSMLLFSRSVMSNSSWFQGLLVFYRLPEFAQTHVHWVSDAFQPSHPLLPPSLSAFNLSQHQGLFQWVSSLHQVGKVLELQLQHQSFQWIFRVDFLWFDLLAIQGPLKSLLQHHNSQASIFWHSAFLMVQLLHPYMTTGKTIALTIWPLLAEWCLCFLICCLGWS